MAYEKIQAAFDARDCHTIVPEEPAELARVLELHDIDHTQWGLGATKTLEQLFEEIRNNESRLVEPRDTSVLGRMVRVAAVDITTQVAGIPLRLVEERQVFRNNSERTRDLQTSISEKIMGGESPEEAAVRGMREELDVAYEGLLTHVADRLVIRESSNGYPGLLSIYRTHTFAAQFSEQEYNPDGYIEVQPDKTTYFGWHPFDEG